MNIKIQRLIYKEKIFFAILILWAVFSIPGLPNQSKEEMISDVNAKTPKKIGKRNLVGFGAFLDLILKGKRIPEKNDGRPRVKNEQEESINMKDVKRILKKYPKDIENKPLFWRQVEFHGLGLLSLKPPDSTLVRVSYDYLSLTPDLQKMHSTYELGRLVPSTINNSSSNKKNSDENK